MDRAAVIRCVSDLAEPLALAAGLELVDVQYVPERGRLVLRVLLDRPEGGITIDELSRMSRELGDVIDAHDAVHGKYTLECSSPGLNRPLVRPVHFERAVGKKVAIRMRDMVGDRRQFRGELLAVDGEAVTVRDSQVGEVRLALADVDKANVEFDFARPAGPPHAHA